MTNVIVLTEEIAIDDGYTWKITGLVPPEIGVAYQVTAVALYDPLDVPVSPPLRLVEYPNVSPAILSALQAAQSAGDCVIVDVVID